MQDRYVTLEFDPEKYAQDRGFLNVTDYQSWYNLKPDGIPGPITTSHMAQPRCGVRDRLPVGTQRDVWPDGCKNNLDVWYELRGMGLSHDVIQQAWEDALGMWNDACDITLKLVAQPVTSKIDARSGPLPGSTLAWSELPIGSCGVTLNQKYDSTQRWTAEKLTKVILHEVGHAIGLLHSNNNRDIMYPSIQPLPLSEYLSDNDKQQVVEFYGSNEPEPDGDIMIVIPRAGTYKLIRE